MSELDIIKHLCRFIDGKKYPFKICNAFIYDWESDFWAMDAKGETREFEIKISRSDFLADAKKAKHSSDDGANFFYYVCPEGLIKPNEVRPKYGLIYVYEHGGFLIAKKPVRLNSNKFNKWEKLASKMYWRWFSLWKEKFIKEEIHFDQYKDGFPIKDFNE